MHAVQLQLQAWQQVHDHDPQHVVEDPGGEARKMSPGRVRFEGQGEEKAVHIFCLEKISKIIVTLYLRATLKTETERELTSQKLCISHRCYNSWPLSAP